MLWSPSVQTKTISVKSQKDALHPTLLNDLSWNISEQDYPPSCTSSGCMYGDCVKFHPGRRCCACKTFVQTEGQGNSYIPPKTVFASSIHMYLYD